MKIDSFHPSMPHCHAQDHTSVWPREFSTNSTRSSDEKATSDVPKLLPILECQSHSRL